jgi:hypothetical protein
MTALIHHIKTQSNMRIILCFLIFHLFSNLVLAQTSVFYFLGDDNNEYSDPFDFEFTNLNFIKNNEYSNHITDGYTLLGTQLQPMLTYNRNKNIRFKTGIMAIKYFGEDNIDIFIPLFSFHHTNKNHCFIFGNYTPRNNHGMIEPVMGNEKVLSSELVETGFQYKYNSSSMMSELWFHWENYIRPRDNDREKFTVGASSKFRISNELSTSLQGYIYHEGGQINKKVSGSLNSSKLNYFVGAIGFKYKFIASLKGNISLNSYFMFHKNSETALFPFENGGAHSLYFDYVYKGANLLFGYYDSDKFISPKGNEIFQSFSQKSNIHYRNGAPDDRFKGFVAPNRRLIFSRFFYEKYLDQNIKVGLQFEGYYQLNNSQESTSIMNNKKGQFDTSFGIYMFFYDVFKL